MPAVYTHGRNAVCHSHPLQRLTLLQLQTARDPHIENKQIRITSKKGIFYYITFPSIISLTLHMKLIIPKYAKNCYSQQLNIPLRTNELGLTAHHF